MESEGFDCTQSPKMFLSVYPNPSSYKMALNDNLMSASYTGDLKVEFCMNASLIYLYIYPISHEYMIPKVILLVRTPTLKIIMKCSKRSVLII